MSEPDPAPRLPDFSRRLWLIAVAIAVMAVLSAFHVRAVRDVEEANANRLRSLQLAGELRQSSDDLTRMARSYAATGKLRFRRHYEEIVAIRDGKLPRPQHYEDVYWDLVLEDEQRPRPPSDERRSLSERMKAAGFVDAEFAALERAKINSEALARTEMAAMLLVEADAGKGGERRRDALVMLHDDDYHAIKAAIMAPIGEFTQMVEARTERAVGEREFLARLLRLCIAAIGLTLIYLLWSAWRALHEILGDSPQALHARIVELGSGEHDTPLVVPARRRNSVLGWLAQARERLGQLSAERRKAMQEAERLAYYDALTDLPNRRLLVDRLTTALAASRRSGQYLALMFMDLDNFKPLNDTHGHDAGDALLVEAAKRLAACMRECDTVARFGGDEFVVLLCNLDESNAVAQAGATVAAEKILARLSMPYALQMADASPLEHRCSASIGVVVARGSHCDIDTLMKLADGAMYRAKQAGRGQIAVSALTA